jgi:hypothetical protein
MDCLDGKDSKFLVYVLFQFGRPADEGTKIAISGQVVDYPVPGRFSAIGDTVLYGVVEYRSKFYFHIRIRQGKLFSG